MNEGSMRRQVLREPSQDDSWLLLVFSLDGQRYALRLGVVEHIERSAEITPLPNAPEVVLGVLNVRGEIIPVVNIRRRFRLPERELRLGDHLILAQTRARRVGLLADSVEGVADQPEASVIEARRIVPGLEHVEGVAKLQDGIVLIHDLDKFLSMGEEQHLQRALKSA
jgi:purine-binding chemotaxis protein CheW